MVAVSLKKQEREAEHALVEHVDHPETRRRVELERRCVAAVGAGCLAPVAAHHDGGYLRALVADEDGAWIERAEGGDPEQLAARLAAARAARLAA